MKVSDVRGVQLCYGGFEKGDSENPGYDWWQLLVVGPGDPPFRGILGQSSERGKLMDAGTEIAAHLSVPWIDDGDYRGSENEAETKTPGRVDAEGVIVLSGSNADEGSDLNLDELWQKTPSLSKRGERILACVILLLGAGIGWAIWSIDSVEKMEQQAAEVSTPIGPSLAVELPELLANGEKYKGRKVRTTGYVRLVTVLVGHKAALDMPERPTRTLYALSPEPVDLRRRIKGGTVGQTGVTNLLVETKEWLSPSFSTGSNTNITPNRTVEGVFAFNGKEHTLSLISWVMAVEATVTNAVSSRER